MDNYSSNEREYNMDNMSEKSVEKQTFTKKRPTYFTSNVQGMFIRNAISGVEYPWRVGTNAARCLFRVVDATGVYDKEGRRLKSNSPEYPNPNPNSFYYDNPQQFMQHRKTKLNPLLIEQWKVAQLERGSQLESGTIGKGAHL